MNLDENTNMRYCQQRRGYVKAEDMSILKLRNMTLHLCENCKSRKLDDLKKERSRLGNAKPSYFI